MSTTERARPDGQARGGGTAGGRPLVSVIVPTWNRASYLPHLFAALSRQVYPAAAMEVLVVDNSSTDDTEAVVERWAARMPMPVRFHRKPNDGPASSRNVGAALARGAVLAFTDSDCIPEPSWLANGVRHLGDADIVCGPMYGLPGEHRGRVTFQGKQAREDDGTFPTGNLLMWRTWFDRVAGFDTRYGIYPWGGLVAGEDTDMVWRAKRRGARTRFHPDVIVGHQPTPAARLRDAALAPVIVQIFPHLVRSIPELRRTKLHRRYFLSAEQMRFDLAAAGVGAAVVARRWWPAALAVPFLAAVRRTVAWEARVNGWSSAGRLFGRHCYAGGASLVVLLWSSARNRRLVL